MRQQMAREIATAARIDATGPSLAKCGELREGGELTAQGGRFIIGPKSEAPVTG
jgi:hypothetical protein